jgi:hypothetical protein
MSRALVQVPFLFTLLFTAIIGLIHVHPYDDGELRAFLTPLGDCPPPCFMGLQPGTTTRQEAAEILERHAWVQDIDIHPSGYWINISRWSGLQPPFIDARAYGHVRISAQGVVSEIEIPTTVQAGYIHLALGAPPMVDLGVISSPLPAVLMLDLYADRSLYTSAFVVCPSSYRHLLEAPVKLTISSILNDEAGVRRSDRWARWVQYSLCW